MNKGYRGKTTKTYCPSPITQYLKPITCFVLLFVASSLHAAFQYLDVGARALGMSGAYVSMGDDATAIYWNPAGISFIKDKQFTGMYTQLFPEIDDSLSLGYISYVHPLKNKLSIGISSVLFGSDLYSESVIGLTLAGKIPYLKNWHMGTNLKLMKKQYGNNLYTALDPTFTRGYTAQGTGIDIGIMYRKDRLGFGYMAKNLNRPNIHIYKRDFVPQEYKTGINYTLFGTKLALDYLSMKNSNKDKRYLFGIERWQGKAAIRTGYATGNNGYAGYAIGLSYICRFGNSQLQIDYSYNQRLDEAKALGANHNFSTTFRF